METAERARPSYGSVEMLDEKGELIVGGARAWVKAGAQKEAQRRLREAAGSTCMWEEGDMRLERRGEREEAMAEEVLAGRAQLGDERRYCSRVAKAMVREKRCPVGCGCAYTWHDVAFVCRGAAVCAARRRWEQEVIEAEALLTREHSHSQWTELRRRLAAANGAARGAGLSKLECGNFYEQRMRRTVGGCVDDPGLGERGLAARAVKAVGRAVAAGLELQLAAQAAAQSLEAEIREEVRRVSRARPWARTWMRAVVRGGPRRAAALAETAEARFEALRRVEVAEEAGERTVEEARCARRRVEEVARQLAVVQRRTVASLSERRGLVEWRAAAIFVAWRWRAAKAQGRGRHTEILVEPTRE